MLISNNTLLIPFVIIFIQIGSRKKQVMVPYNKNKLIIHFSIWLFILSFIYFLASQRRPPPAKKIKYSTKLNNSMISKHRPSAQNNANMYKIIIMYNRQKSPLHYSITRCYGKLSLSYFRVILIFQ